MATSINFSSRQLTIYFGIPILITGLIGGILNIIVFLSLKTFRENSCAFYLTIMSIVNLGHLSTGLFTRILISGFNMDLTASSVIYCKFRVYCVQSCISISLTCMCLATIDQFLATCSQPRWRHWSNIKIAHRLIVGFIILWLLHGIPHTIFFNDIQVSSSKKCTSTNDIFQIYLIGVQTIIFQGLSPILINTLFGLLAYRNVQELAYRTIPLVRRELDKQMTIIILIQAVYNFLTSFPYVIINILSLISFITKNQDFTEQYEFINLLIICIFYLNFSVSDNRDSIIFLKNISRVHFISTYSHLDDSVNNLSMFLIRSISIYVDED